MRISKTSITSSFLIIVAILGVMFSALQYFSNPRPSLHATVHGYPHHHLIDWEHIDVLERHGIYERSIFGKNSGHVERVHGVFHIFLENNGNEIARNVSIIVDYAIGMMVARDNETEVILGDKTILGDMKPNEEATVISWTTTSERLHQFSRPRVTITYDNGIVDLDQRYEIEGVLRFVHKNHLHIFSIPVFALLLFVVSMLIFGTLTRRIEKKKPDESSVNIDDKKEN